MALFDVDPMGGLLSPEMQAQVKNQTLLSLGLGLMQGAGPSFTPTSLGQVLGQAGQGAMQTGQSLTDRAVAQALRGRQLAKEQSEEDRLKRARESAAGAVPANLRDSFMLDPATAQAAAGLAPQPTKPDFVKDFKLPDGSTISGYITPQGFMPIGGPVAPEPTVDEKKQVLALRTAQDTLNNLQNTFKETGTEMLPTAKAATLQSQYRNLQLQLKELYNLGVLNGPDLGILENVLIDPTSAGASLLSNDRVKASFDEVQRFINNKESALLQSSGVRAREGNSIVGNEVPLGLSNVSDDDLLSAF
jgi:hypothetical protein